MTEADLRARVRRLDELSRGMARELVRVQECDDPLLYRERQDYLAALRVAVSGLEAGRVALAQALQRLEAGRAGP